MNKDLVVDSCVMRLFDTPSDPNYQILFQWIKEVGTLCVSNPLINEYNRHGNQLVWALLNYLGTQNRLNKISNNDLKSFNLDKNFSYSCNGEDISHARLTFCSTRKKLVSFDGKLRDSVNGFKRVNGIKPKAVKTPSSDFLA